MSEPTKAPQELKIAVMRWVCPKGHVTEGYPESFSVNAVHSGKGTGNICPDCYVEWIAANVPKVMAVELRNA